jgi:hypothetical protein
MAMSELEMLESGHPSLLPPPIHIEELANAAVIQFNYYLRDPFRRP